MPKWPFPLLFLLLAFGPAASAWAALDCPVSKLSCSSLPKDRQDAEKQCNNFVQEANRAHIKFNQTNFVRTRAQFFKNFREKLHSLCSLKNASATAVGNVKPTAEDCSSNSELMQLGQAATTPEDVLNRQKENFNQAKHSFLNDSRVNVQAGQQHLPAAEATSLQQENLALWGTQKTIELPPGSTLPQRGLYSSLLRLWEKELTTLGQNQTAAAQLAKSGADLKARCASLPPGEIAKAEVEGGKKDPSLAEELDPNNPKADPSAAEKSAGEGEESWASRNKGLLIAGGLGVGAAAVVGAIFYKKNQDKKKLSSVTEQAVNNWENENKEKVEEIDKKVEENEKKQKDFDTGELETREVSGQTLKFFPHVAAFLDDVEKGVAGETITPAKTNCPAHEELMAGMPNLAPKDSFECNEAQEAVKEIFKGGTACMEVQTPVEFFSILPVTKPELTKMGDLEEALKVYGPALVRMGLLGAFKKQSYYDRLSSVLVKVRIKTIREKLEKRQNFFLKANKDLMKGGKCLRGTPEDQKKAIDLFGRAHTETLALLHELEAIEIAGAKRAQEDLNKVVAKEGKRNELMYPSLTDQDRKFLATALGAFLWRSRGGGIFHEPTNTNIRRSMFTLLPWEPLGKVSGGSKASGFGGKLWAALFSPWGKFHDMGRLDGDKVSDLKEMRNRGVEQLSSIRSDLKSGGFDPNSVDVAGPMMGDCYWFGWEKLEKITMGVDLDNQRPYQHAIAGPTQWGEFCTGASFGYGMADAMLKGYR